MKKHLATALIALAGTQAMAMEEGGGLVTAFMVDELEYVRQSGDNPMAWSAAFMAGTELNQFWLVSEGERVKGSIEGHELRSYFAHGIYPKWNLTVGWRGDVHPDPERNWFMVGFEGEAPFFVETEVLFFAGSESRSGMRVTLEKEMMLTQRWQLVPEVEFEVHGHNDEETGTGSGLSSVGAAVRLAYEVTPRFTPYLGLSWGRSYGQTADYLREEGEDIDGGQVLLGIKFWL